MGFRALGFRVHLAMVEVFIEQDEMRIPLQETPVAAPKDHVPQELENPGRGVGFRVLGFRVQGWA